MSPTHQDLSNDTTFSQIKSRVPVPLSIRIFSRIFLSSTLFNIIIIIIGHFVESEEEGQDPQLQDPRPRDPRQQDPRFVDPDRPLQPQPLRDEVPEGRQQQQAQPVMITGNLMRYR